MFSIIPFTTVKSPYYYPCYNTEEIIKACFPSDSNGLNCIQSAILKSLYEVRKGMGDHPYTKKTIYFVGTVLQNYPFSIGRVAGDIYQMVRSGYLIKGNGNFGFYDDPFSPGNFRDGALISNTEVRLSDFAYDCMLKGNDDVMFALPVLLLQGAYVDVCHRKCAIPPHHLSDIIDCAIAYLKGENYYLQPVNEYNTKIFNNPAILISEPMKKNISLERTTVHEIFESYIITANKLFDSTSSYINWLSEMRTKYCFPDMSMTVCRADFERQMNYLKTERE